MPRGTTVEFPNNDNDYHNIYSLSRIKRFDAGRYKKSEAPVLVVDSPWSTTTDAAGKFTLDASGLMPPGKDRGDFTQNTLGLDARWAHHNLIVSGEIVLSEFETPAAGDLRTASWFLQTRWKVLPGVWLAGRFGRITTNDATDSAGNDVTWQPDVWRAEIGGGWRVTPDVIFKGGYSFTHAAGDGDAGEHLLGTGIG